MAEISLVTDQMDPNYYNGEFAGWKTKLGETVPDVRTVLVVLSSAAMVFDSEGIRQKIMMVYNDAAIFFRTTSGKALGVPSPEKVDLLIDLTGPGQRQGLFYAFTLKRMARVSVGRNAGFFRKKLYDFIFDEKVESQNLPIDVFERERLVQKTVLALAGVPFVVAGATTPNREKMIALELPPLTS